MATADTRTYATGKRKTAIARVWLKPGTGTIVVNGRPVDEYFERETSRMVLRQALELIEAQDQFDVWATCVGGGKSAQAEAMRHGISRALIAFDPEKRGAVKRAGFLTRDARKKERKKYGRPGARKRFQYSKR
jgi:small subunit ribosomal protein S9